MTKLKELAAATSSADEGASVAYKIKVDSGAGWLGVLSRASAVP
nr:hypothetical protein [uncultured bacterium]